MSVTRKVVWVHPFSWTDTEGKRHHETQCMTDDGIMWFWTDDMGWIPGRIATPIPQGTIQEVRAGFDRRLNGKEETPPAEADVETDDRNGVASTAEPRPSRATRYLRREEETAKARRVGLRRTKKPQTPP